MTFVRVRDLGTGSDLELRPTRLVIAGFTGRDHEAVQAHVDELRELGVPVPERTPTFYEVDPTLLTTLDRIEVSGSFTSGEVEPVLVVHQGARYLAVGSDHTDRDVERSSIAASKGACPKPISREVFPLTAVSSWDDLELISWADGSDEMYQEGRLAQMLPLEAILEDMARSDIELRDGDVLFLGTVPVLGDLRASRSFSARLRDPAAGTAIDVQYAVDLQ